MRTPINNSSSQVIPAAASAPAADAATGDVSASAGDAATGDAATGDAATTGDLGIGANGPSSDVGVVGEALAPAPEPGPISEVTAITGLLDAVRAALPDVYFASVEGGKAAAKLFQVSDAACLAIGDLLGAHEAIERTTTDFQEVASQRDALTVQVADLQGQLADVQAQLAAATATASLTKGGKQSKARAAIVMEAPNADDARALAMRIRSEAMTIVFSDGQRELLSLEPMLVAGAEAWNETARGMALREAFTIKPDRPLTLAGFALLDAKGKQLAWSGLSQPIDIGAGQEVQLARQIVF